MLYTTVSLSVLRSEKSPGQSEATSDKVPYISQGTRILLRIEDITERPFDYPGAIALDGIQYFYALEPSHASRQFLLMHSATAYTLRHFASIDYLPWLDFQHGTQQ